MPGMNSGLSPDDPTVVAAFRSALLHQGAIALILLVFLMMIWATARTWRPAPGARPEAGDAGATQGDEAQAGEAGAQAGESRGRWLLRTGFGTIWILDGILQAQSAISKTLWRSLSKPSPTRSVARSFAWSGRVSCPRRTSRRTSMT